MVEHPNVTLVRRVYELFTQGDVEGFLQLLADDVVWHVPGRCPIAGDYKGRQAVLGYLGAIDELSGGTYQISELHDVIANDDHVVGLHHSVATRPGKTTTTRPSSCMSATAASRKSGRSTPTNTRSTNSGPDACLGRA